MQILLGTNNPGKVIEIGEGMHGLPVTLLTPDALQIIDIPNETGTTFAENAVLKARYYFEKSALPTVADDSGILVEALRDELGIHTRRWGAGPKASDEEWITFFLDRMKREKNRRAAFVCAMAYIDASGSLHQFEGRCSGSITEELEAAYLPGLPISAVFRPDGFLQVFSALSIEQKNSTSHRGRAVTLLREHLEKEIAEKAS